MVPSKRTIIFVALLESAAVVLNSSIKITAGSTKIITDLMERLKAKKIESHSTGMNLSKRATSKITASKIKGIFLNIKSPLE